METVYAPYPHLSIRASLPDRASAEFPLFLTPVGKHAKMAGAGVRIHLRQKVFLGRRKMAKKILLVVGLGNPGDKYAHTRHNAGFEVLDRLAASYGVKLRKKLLLQGQTAEITDGETKVVLCEPLTFMNRSGECVRKLLNRYRVPEENLLLIYDDIDLPPGKVRVRPNGGPGTHNGMRSIAECIGNTAFPRIRVGTGDRPAGEDLAAWVLGHPSPEDRVKLEAAFDHAADCARVWITDGIEKAMQR